MRVLTVVDALVMARSAFHHSINYRSVMLFGTARTKNERDEHEDPERPRSAQEIGPARGEALERAAARLAHRFLGPEVGSVGVLGEQLCS